MALVDILMPVRDGEPYLVEALQSVLVQTFPDWRLVAVDDRSRDGTWEILCAFSTRDERILSLKNEGSGIVGALNTALVHSRAPYIARMDADDISGPHRLENLLNLLGDEPSAGVAGSAVALFPSKAVTPNMERYIGWQNSLLTPDQIRRERYVESTVTHATAMFRREILTDAEGWREGPFPEDLDLWLRLHRAGVNLIKHPEELYSWREHEARETRNSERCTPEAFHRCKLFHLAGELKDRHIKKLAVLGPTEARERWTRSLAEKGFQVTSIAWKPGNPLQEQVFYADFILTAFGVPGVRNRAREILKKIGQEEDKWLFVG